MAGPTHTDPVQDYTAAMNEIRSNLDVRRLMLVVSYILVPALAMAMTDCLTGSDYPPQIAWLPENILTIVGVTLAVTGTLVTGILARCHFGLVVNGSKMRRVVTGKFSPQPLNWLGVTTNFTALTALSAGAGFGLIFVSVGQPWPAAILGPAFAILLLSYLRITHWRANRLSGRLLENWQTGEVKRELQEENARLSLEATTSDVSVVVTVGVALFAGTFNSMTNVGGMAQGVNIGVPLDVLKTGGMIALSGYTFLSLLLSGRIVVRLRIALAEHSLTLAGLRNEPDDPYRFTLRERTFLLFLLQHLMTSVCALILAWTLGGAVAGVVTGVVLMVLGGLWYPDRLCRARPRPQSSVPFPDESFHSGIASEPDLSEVAK